MGRERTTEEITREKPRSEHVGTIHRFFFFFSLYPLPCFMIHFRREIVMFRREAWYTPLCFVRTSHFQGHMKEKAKFVTVAHDQLFKCFC